MKKLFKQVEFKHVMEQLSKINEYIANNTEFSVVALDEQGATLKNNEDNMEKDDDISCSQSSVVST